MDYSIHDAIEAGFNHVVFIIRKDIEKEFKEVIGERIKATCSVHDVIVDYAFQDINDIPGTLPEGRKKPWGTGQAVLAAKGSVRLFFDDRDTAVTLAARYVPAGRHLLQHSRWSARRIDVLCGDEGKKTSVKLDEIVIYWERKLPALL